MAAASKNQNKTNVNAPNSLAYVSSVFMSTSVNKPAIGIAVPVYDNNWKTSKQSLLG